MRASMEELLERGLPVERHPDKCWEWTRKAHLPGGYGLVSGYGSASRVSYQVFVGPIPQGMLVCHTCDNPPCCNPAHLFLGTHKDNTADKVAKGRAGKRLRPKEAGTRRLINIPDAMWTKVRIEAAKSSTTATEYVTRAIEKQLALDIKKETT